MHITDVKNESVLVKYAIPEGYVVQDKYGKEMIINENNVNEFFNCSDESKEKGVAFEVGTKWM